MGAANCWGWVVKTVAKRTGQRVLLERGESPPGEGGRVLLEMGGRVLLEREENPLGEGVYHSLQLPQDPPHAL